MVLYLCCELMTSQRGSLKILHNKSLWTSAPSETLLFLSLQLQLPVASWDVILTLWLRHWTWAAAAAAALVGLMALEEVVDQMEQLWAGRRWTPVTAAPCAPTACAQSGWHGHVAVTWRTTLRFRASRTSWSSTGAPELGPQPSPAPSLRARCREMPAFTRGASWAEKVGHQSTCTVACSETHTSEPSTMTSRHVPCRGRGLSWITNTCTYRPLARQRGRAHTARCSQRCVTEFTGRTGYLFLMCCSISCSGFNPAMQRRRGLGHLV